MRARAVAEVALPAAVAIVTFALVVWRAVTTVDPYWDTLAYHWIFAARVAGLCGASCFDLPPLLQALYDGFPLAVHALQGLLWRVLGKPDAGDLVNVLSLCALCAYLRWRFRVPLAWAWLAMLAIPVVQIELTSSYVDLAVNAAATLAVFVLLRMALEPARDHRPDVLIALAALALATGGKTLMLPVALLTWGAIMLLAWRQPSLLRTKRRGLALMALAIAGATALLPKYAMNAMTFANPLYPVRVETRVVELPGPFPMEQSNAVSTKWAAFPQPVRWIASVAEFDAFEGRPLPWIISQGDVPQTSVSYRMGGYFVAYVLGALALLAWNTTRRRGGALPLATMGVLSLLCAFLPSSHELRYYLFWMTTLVGLVLVMAYGPAFASSTQAARRPVAHALILISLASVVMMTGASYFRTDAQTLDQIVAPRRATVATVPDGGTLCIRDGSRWGFLYAEIFHPGRHYRTRLLAGDEPDPTCTVRVSAE